VTITEKTKRLFNSEDFQDVILKRYIKDGIVNISLRENVDSKNVQNELISRKNLNDYLINCLDLDNIKKIRKENK